MESNQVPTKQQLKTTEKAPRCIEIIDIYGNTIDCVIQLFCLGTAVSGNVVRTTVWQHLPGKFKFSFTMGGRLNI